MSGLVVNLKLLSELSLLNTALSREYASYLAFAAESCLSERVRQSILNSYVAYCYVMKQGNYTGFDILNDSRLLNKHFQLLVGFIYSSDYLSIQRKYEICNQLKTVFHYIAQDKQLSLDEIKLSSIKISVYVSSCLNKFQQLEVDRTKVDYLNGWQVVSKGGKRVEAHLDTLYVNFGADFTDKVHHALKNYALKYREASLKGAVGDLKTLFGGMISVYVEKDGQTIETYLNRNHVQLFFHKVFKVLFVRSQASQHCPKSFHTQWRNIVQAYTECFIVTGVFDEPNKPFIVPVWKDPKDKAPIFSAGGNVTSNEKMRWFAHIPQKVKDEEAISIIERRLDRDMAHIKYVCLTKFNEFLELEARNKTFIKIGIIKPLDSNSHSRHYYNTVGPDQIGNTVATFYTHGIGAKKNYSKFLGFKGNVRELTTELNLPTTSTLNVLLTLLVMEHPRITPSWLERWELFDVYDNQVGYKQTGNQYIAVSYKLRKGSTKAQQEVVLNEFSKSVVEFLIQHTHIAREYLKEKGDTNWRKMILTASSCNNATCLTNLNGNLLSENDFHGWLQEKSLFDKNCCISKEDAQAISEIHSLRSIRRHRGLQIYLETRSMDTVADTLGHERMYAKLLTSYLPKPLMDFFNDRWVRQFQNAILLEAMKDSEYRLEAASMSAEDIEEFLNNHGVSLIPEGFGLRLPEQTKAHMKGSEPEEFNQITYTISTSLLQLLMAIRFVVESSDNGDQSFLDIVHYWYQSAVFILNTLNSGKHDADTDLMDMLEVATQNKLDINLIKGTLLC